MINIKRDGEPEVDPFMCVIPDMRLFLENYSAQTLI